MMRRIVIASLAFTVAYGLPASVSAQSGSMSDATGATVGLFSRVLVRAFAAPPAPPPTLVVAPEILDALCVERADAMFVYASLSDEASDRPTRTAVRLLRGGAGSDAAAGRMQSAIVGSGADPGDAERLVNSANGLLMPERPEPPDVATAVGHYNELVEGAPLAFLADPPDEFLALRQALGRLTAAANSSFSSERVYPDLPPANVRYANGSPWLITGEPIEVLGQVYLQFGIPVKVGERRFQQVAEHEDVSVLSEMPVMDPPAEVYVPLRRYCDIELQPYVMAQPIIKGEKRSR